MLAHLNVFARQFQLSWQAVEHAIIGDISIPGDLSLLGGEALPGKVLRQGQQLLLRQPLDRAHVGGAMDAAIDALAPSMCLAVQIIQIGEADTRPEALFHMAHGALHLALRLRGVSLADPRSHANRDHEVRKARIPARLVVLHFQQHALHPIGEGNFRESAEVLTCLHEATNQRRGITTFHKGDETHTGIAKNGGKSIKFMHLASVFVHKFSPVELNLLPWLCFIALDRRVPSHRRPQRMHKFLQNTDPTSIAHLLQAGKDDLAIGAVVLRDPLRDLLFKRIELRGPRWPWFADHRLWMVEIFAHGRSRDLQFLRNFLHALPLDVKIVYC